MSGNSRLTTEDIARAADVLGVAPAAIFAITEVEAPGGGFLDDSRPKILYERHVMYKRLKTAGHDAEAIAAKFPAIVSPERGGYKGGLQEWYRLGLARQINVDIANESASWGRFQIMGYHWKTCGFENVSEFVVAVSESEARQLDAFVAFIKADPPLLKALKACKWAEVAKRYNGPNYRDNDYDTKLAAAYELHAGEAAA